MTSRQRQLGSAQVLTYYQQICKITKQRMLSEIRSLTSIPQHKRPILQRDHQPQGLLRYLLLPHIPRMMTNIAGVHHIQISMMHARERPVRMLVGILRDMKMHPCLLDQCHSLIHIRHLSRIVKLSHQYGCRGMTHMKDLFPRPSHLGHIITIIIITTTIITGRLMHIITTPRLCMHSRHRRQRRTCSLCTNRIRWKMENGHMIVLLSMVHRPTPLVPQVIIITM